MASSATRDTLFPAADRATAATVVLAGALALLASEVFARFAAPSLIGGVTQPAELIQAVLGIADRRAAEGLHLGLGLVALPLAYLFLARPLFRLMFPEMPAPVAGLVFGAALWVAGLYAAAHLVAGFPPFLGFAPAAWGFLAAQAVFGLVLALVIRMREGRPQ